MHRSYTKYIAVWGYWKSHSHRSVSFNFYH